MKTKLAAFVVFFYSLVFSQNKIFQNSINENNLTGEQKISKGLASTYSSTSYFNQSPFDLNSDFKISLPTHKEITAKFSRLFKYSNKSKSYVYTVENDPNAELVLSTFDNIVTGMYVSGNGEKVIFHQTDTNIFAVSVVNEAGMINQDSKNDFISNPSSNLLKVNTNVCVDATAVCPSTTIDVLVVYTSDAKTNWGGNAQSISFIATAITNFNTALGNSGVSNVMINLVYSGEISYTESGNISTDLSRFHTANDGFLDDVQTLRTTYGADLCGLITSTPNNTCGLGYLNTNPTNYSSNSAFTVSIYSCVVSNYTLSHEMGHNMGLNHDWYVSQSTTPCNHHHGYSNQAAVTSGTGSISSQRWRTIMAYNDECANAGISCTRVNRWANPGVNYNGAPTGIAIGNPSPSNEAYGFSRFACVVSQFMPTANLGTFEVQNSDVKDFTIFPNPAYDELNVWIKNDEKYIFKVINVLGQVVLTTDKKTIHLKKLTPGEYFVSIYTEKNTLIGSKKFIKK
ncbi:zinc-dependent metalloprotease [Chryseobacterium camelliae]|uniref:Zinc-dependent metalloprotease n=1 Tax=Chryseobacterium camelliae TaxID=1265445 RepID=A0ABY7QQ60_9FLAO|nr:zinc-dependent metalloprotease [Chryseobacterium camelliae]WBV61801.1 zinc-dependent metalloprotease [Chryseobacterium camelliae]